MIISAHVTSFVDYFLLGFRKKRYSAKSKILFGSFRWSGDINAQLFPEKMMNNAQKSLLIDRMNSLDEESMSDHAAWATNQFNEDVSAKECSDILIDSIFADTSNTLRFIQ